MADNENINEIEEFDLEELVNVNGGQNEAAPFIFGLADSYACRLPDGKPDYNKLKKCMSMDDRMLIIEAILKYHKPGIK